MEPVSPLEISWFGALCDDDYEFLGVEDPKLASSWDHCRNIALEAERLGFDNLLLPSGYQLGIDSVSFASAIAPQLDRMKLLIAVRAGEMWPPQLARQLATVDQMLGRDDDGRSRLTINIISSDLPGAPLDSAPRYARTREVMAILRTLLDGEPTDHHGDFFDLEVAAPRVTGLVGGCPPMYFGGLSEPAREVAAAEADVYLMWPDTFAGVAELISDMDARASLVGRTLRYGLRVHVIVRETEIEARVAAEQLVSRLDDTVGEQIRQRSLDTGSVGVTRQTELRAAAAPDGFIEDHLWTGIGRARSGCGAAIVGDPTQVAATIERYRSLGVDSFILSGYPHLEEARRFSELVLPLFR